MKEDCSTQNKELGVVTLTGQKLMGMFDLMLAHFGHQYWWPAESDLEVMVGAVLTQNTNWKNVEKAIDNLRKKGLLTMNALYSLSTEALAREIRSAGYYNIKAKRLKNLINFVREQYGENLSDFMKGEQDDLEKN